MQTTLMMSMLLMFTLMAMCTKSVLFTMVMLVMTALMTTATVAYAISSWFAFILFLIYVTGLLVLFSYMMAMTPNNFSLKPNFPKMTIFTAIFLMLMKTTQPMMPSKVSQNMQWHIYKMYDMQNMTLYWAMAMILLMALLVVVNVTYKSPIPLRPFL